MVKIHTVATEPLKLGDYTLERLEEKFEQAVKNEVPLRYETDYVEDYHQFVGLTIHEVL